MKDYTGIIPTTMLSGEGTAVEEIATKWTPEVLDERLGKLPKRCFPLIIAGNLNLNPFNQGDYPNDGLITQEETYLPGHFRHVVSYIIEFGFKVINLIVIYIDCTNDSFFCTVSSNKYCINTFFSSSLTLYKI
jgi:hypothetical protein